MPEPSSTVVVEAGPPAVAAALREVAVLRRTAAGRRPGCSQPAWRGTVLLLPGDELRLRLRPAPGLRIPLRVRAAPDQAPGRAPDRWSATVLAGPLPVARYTAVLTRTAAGTRLTVSVSRAPLAWRGSPVAPVVRAALRRHLAQVRVRAEQLATAPVVVAAAVCDAQRVLAQQRARPAAAAGRWELPGGQVEPGESAQDALVRECREELAVDAVAGGQLGPDVPLPGGRVLRVYRARLADPRACPVPVEHAALRWVGTAELAGLDWLDADRVVLPDLARLLGAG